MLTELLRLYTKICIALGIGIDAHCLPNGKYKLIHETPEITFKIYRTYYYKSIVKDKKGKWIFVLSQRPLPLKFRVE
jgi:hypothetical protein